MKRRDLLRLHNAISMLEGRQFSVKFSYFIAKNKVAMRDEISAIDKARIVNDEFKAFDTERAKLAQQYADKNEDGSSKIQNNNFVITTNIDIFQEKLKVLRKEYKDAIDKQEQQMKDFEEFLDQDTEFNNGSKIDFKDIPTNIEPSILECLILADLIIEEE